MNQPRHLPAEWAPQWAVMLTWPHAGMDCQRNFAEVEALFLTLASAIAQRQQLIVSVTQPQQLDALRDHLRQAGIAAERLIGQVVPANDFWARDHGPITVLSGDQPRLLDFRFNGWGGKYPAELDNQISSQLHRRGAFGSAALEPIDWVFEGGNLECDGAGTLLLNRQSVLTASRNPGLNEAMVEAEFRRLLGIDRVLWISHGHIEGDDTDGHIDVLARFTASTFLFLLPGTGPDGALVLARRMLQSLRERTFAEGVRLQPYAGMAWTPQSGITDRKAFLLCAEACLERARSGVGDGGVCGSLE